MGRHRPALATFCLVLSLMLAALQGYSGKDMMGTGGIGTTPALAGSIDSAAATRDRDDEGERDDERGRGHKDKQKQRERLQHHSSSGVAKGDFNADGFGDLAIGMPEYDVSTAAEDAGAVIIIYGSPDGLTTTSSRVPHSQIWTQNTPGVNGGAESGDRFGDALASGDFNGDGFSDLAIGTPGEDITLNGRRFADAGAVVVLYGSSTGLNTSSSAVLPTRFFNFGLLGGSAITGGEHLGSSLAWGDFDNDGLGDLAMGAPGSSEFDACAPTRSFREAGDVWILFGNRTTGLSETREQFLNAANVVLNQRCSEPVKDLTGDHFGAALAAGNFDGAGGSELAIGAPDRSIVGNDIVNAGVVFVVSGFLRDNGVPTFGDSRQTLVFDGFAPPALLQAKGDRYGAVLAAGDFDGNGADDLAIGVPSHAVGAEQDAGVVHVRYGENGATPPAFRSTTQVWSQNALFPNDVINRSEGGDLFGSALAAGDFNGDGFDDLAVGVPLEAIRAVTSSGATTNVQLAGEVDVVYGSAGLLSISGRRPQIWTQDATNVLDVAEEGDLFGASLTAWNFGRGGQADLAIGAPGEDLQQSGAAPGTLVFSAGAVNVIYGSPPGSTQSAANGLTPLGNQFWNAGSDGVPSELQRDAGFGSSVY